MTINISKYRISFFQIETFNGLIPDDAPFGFLGRSDKYEQVFLDEIKREKIILPMHSYNFWKNYLKTKKLEEVNPGEVVRRLFPMFVPSIIKPQLPDIINGRSLINGYCWPHCLACELKLFVNEEQSLESAVDQAMSFRYQPIFTVDKEAVSTIHLSNLLNEAICKLRKYFLGNEERTGESGQLFSIITFIDGNGVSGESEIPCNSLIHKALVGLCKWNRNWRDASYHSFDQNLLANQQDSIPGHAVCHSSRGRAIWFPSNFQQDVQSNSCYHNNVTTLSMQIESLGAMVEMATERYANGILVGGSFEKYSKNAAINLSLLYGGNKKTYRSINAQKQIKDSQFIDPINSVRNHFGVDGPDLV